MNARQTPSDRIRQAVLDLAGRRTLIANLCGSGQARDLQNAPVCRGFGRIHHFARAKESWPPNPLPIDPACRALGLPRTDTIEALVFQVAGCNSHCWYCYVSPDLLRTDSGQTTWLAAEELVAMYEQESELPRIIDLSGGDPGLVPEWLLWMMDALRGHGLQQTVYLWSDDNLTNDYFWTALTRAQRRAVAEYPCYGKVGCLKGFSPEVFTFNTGLPATMYHRQFDLAGRYLEAGIDLFLYVTLTSAPDIRLAASMSQFIDALQAVHHNLPLRTVPLVIRDWSPTKSRLTPERKNAFSEQFRAVKAWEEEIDKRYSAAERSIAICDVEVG